MNAGYPAAIDFLGPRENKLRWLMFLISTTAKICASEWLLVSLPTFHLLSNNLQDYHSIHPRITTEMATLGNDKIPMTVKERIRQLNEQNNGQGVKLDQTRSNILLADQSLLTLEEVPVQRTKSRMESLAGNAKDGLHEATDSLKSYMGRSKKPKEESVISAPQTTTRMKIPAYKQPTRSQVTDETSDNEAVEEPFSEATELEVRQRLSEIDLQMVRYLILNFIDT